MALQWKHIDFQMNTIDIRQALTREIVFDSDGNKKSSRQVVGATKTVTSSRTIQALEIVMSRLREWRLYVACVLEGGSKTLVPDGFVFMNTRTKEMRTYNGFRSSFNNFLKRHGMDHDGIHLHQFRHTYASMLLEQEVNPKIVQKLLGHSDISTTLNVYTHVIPEMYFGVTSKVNEAFAQMCSGTYKPRLSSECVNKMLLSIDSSVFNDA